MARNAIESEFRTSKMAAGSHFVKKIPKKIKLHIDLKWIEMRSKVIFGHPKWPTAAILSKISKKNCVSTPLTLPPETIELRVLGIQCSPGSLDSEFVIYIYNYKIINHNCASLIINHQPRLFSINCLSPIQPRGIN